MEKINVKPMSTDIIPFYGFFNYIGRTTFDINEKPSVKDYLTRSATSLALMVYNGFIGAEILSRAEGRPSVVMNLLEKIIN